MASRLLQVLLLLYRATPEETRQLENDLLLQRRRIFRRTLGEEARKLGCSRSALPQSPRGEDFQYLKAISRLDARSIHNTWNQWVERRLEELYTANPRGNRQYYLRNMERLTAERAIWKDKQIALNTELTAREYARQRFFQMNLSGNRYRLTGPPPVCEVCARQFAAGVVDYAHVQRNPAPLHINCPHQWTPITPGTVNCADLWMG